MSMWKKHNLGILTAPYNLKFSELNYKLFLLAYGTTTFNLLFVSFIFVVNKCPVQILILIIKLPHCTNGLVIYLTKAYEDDLRAAHNPV